MKDAGLTEAGLLALYDRVAEAEDAIPRLRRFVLGFATKGRLIKTDWAGWRSTTLGEVGAWGSGGTPSRTNPEFYGGDIPWLVIGDLNDGLVLRAETHISEAGLSNSSCKLIEPGAVLIAMYGSIGKLGITGIRCVTNQAIAHCIADEQVVTTSYLFTLLRSLRDEFLARGQGVAQQNISQKILKAWPITLPPLAEQHRIVAKVEALMALLDRLEAARVMREETRTRLTAATLSRLTEDEADTPTAARFALQTLPALTTREDQIKTLRQTILNLAVRGKLVEQDARDEPASNLLQSLSHRGAARRRTGKLGDTGISVDRHTAQNLPKSWIWTSLGEIAASMRYGTSVKCERDLKGVPVLRIPNVSSGAVRLDDLKFGPLSDDEKRDLSLLEGDILMIRSNGSLDIVGRSAVVTQEAVGMAFAGYLVRVRLGTDCILPDYVWLVLNSSSVRDQIEKPIRSAVGLKNVNLTEFGALSIPLPPLAEQHRIVAKVEELMSLCDRLESALREAATTRARLLDATLREALTQAQEAA